MSLPAAAFEPLFESCELQAHHTLAASHLEATHQLSADDNEAVVDKDILTILYADSERILKVRHMSMSFTWFNQNPLLCCLATELGGNMYNSCMIWLGPQ